MPNRSRLSESLVFFLVVLGVAVALVVPRLSAYGIWDPWELNVADAARRTLENPGAPAVELDDPQPPLTIQSVALGFRIFGIREWAGRVPMALWGVLAVVLAFVLAQRLYDRRAALFAGIAAATTPLWLLGSRQMLGETPAMAAVGLILVGSLCAVWVPGSTSATRGRDRILWSIVALCGCVVGLFGGGALLAVAPPLLASGIASVIGLRLARVPPPAEPEQETSGSPYRQDPKPPSAPVDQREQSMQSLVAAIVLGLGAAVALAVIVAVALSEAEYSLLVGGMPIGGNPPTWEKVIEQVAHSFVPWVALLPIAVGRTFAAPPRTDDPAAFGRSAALRLALALTAALGFAAHTVYLSRYGESGFVPVVALAGLVGITLRDFEIEERPWRTAALVALLAIAVVIRDYSLYPKSPLEGLGVAALVVPEAFNPKRAWQVLLALFALALYFPLAQGAVVTTKPVFAELFRFERWVADKWRTSMVARAAFIFAATVLLVLFVLGLGSALELHERDIFPWNRTTSLLRRVLIAVGLGAAIAIRLAFLGYALADRVFALLKSYKLVPALVCAVVVAGYTSHVFVPKLSEHFSPREVYDTFNRLARAGEPLGEYRVGGRAAVYYARGSVRELHEQSNFVEFLSNEQRRFVSFPADQLAELDRAYRARKQRHLFVVDARSARVLLASNQPIAGERNQNVLARFVRSHGPPPEHRLNAIFDGRIELVGYDLDTPQPGYVGAGQEFTVTWHWRVIRPVPGGYQLFVHIDGHGQRLNGDHIPVDTAYPINLWAAGDYVLDRQTLKVPTNYSAGAYTMFIGIFSGETRLRLEDGPHDGGENRARVGELVVR